MIHLKKYKREKYKRKYKLKLDNLINKTYLKDKVIEYYQFINIKKSIFI